MANWNTDAQFLDKIEGDYLFANQRIKEFLRPKSYSQFIIVASKGMGKTLLMRHKRLSIQNEEPGILLIPRNETSDYVHLPSSPSNDLLASMRQSSFWSDLWQISISISMLLYFPHKIKEDEKSSAVSDLKKCPLPTELSEQLISAFNNNFVKEVRPSNVLDLLFQLGKNGIEKLRSKGTHTIFELFLT